MTGVGGNRVGEHLNESAKPDDFPRISFNVDRDDFHYQEQSTRQLGVSSPRGIALTTTTFSEGLWSEEHGGSLCLGGAEVGLTHSLLHPGTALLVLRILFAAGSTAAAIALSLFVGGPARRQR